MNRGAELLTATGESQDAIARAVGVTQVAVHGWLKATKKPRRPLRLVIQDRWPAIAPEAWDEPVDAPAPPTTQSASAPPVDAPVPRGARAKAVWLEGKVEALLNRVDQEKSPAVQARVLHTAASTLRILARITGDDANPIVDEIMNVIRAALKPWPEAADAVGAALERAAKKRHNQ